MTTTTALGRTLVLDVSPYSGHVCVYLRGGRDAFHFDQSVSNAVAFVLAETEKDLRAALSAVPWVEA